MFMGTTPFEAVTICIYCSHTGSFVNRRAQKEVGGYKKDQFSIFFLQQFHSHTAMQGIMKRSANLLCATTLANNA